MFSECKKLIKSNEYHNSMCSKRKIKKTIGENGENVLKNISSQGKYRSIRGKRNISQFILKSLYNKNETLKL